MLQHNASARWSRFVRVANWVSYRECPGNGPCRDRFVPGTLLRWPAKWTTNAIFSSAFSADLQLIYGRSFNAHNQIGKAESAHEAAPAALPKPRKDQPFICTY